MGISDAFPFGCDPESGNCTTKTGSVHMNFMRPNAVWDPMWYYNEVMPTESSSTTYFASNSHEYGYAGIQMVSKDSEDGDLAICSIWDQDTGNARTEVCGEGVRCTGFGNEGTGAKALWDFKWRMGKRYAWMIVRKALPGNRLQHACWLYAEELEGRYPGGWKHIATVSSGRRGNRDAFLDAGSFVEQWSHMNSRDLRRAYYGPAFYKEHGGAWGQAEEAKFHPYCDPGNLERHEERCDHVAAGEQEIDGRKLLWMSTGGLRETASSELRLSYPKQECGLPAPLYAFEVHSTALLSAGSMSDLQEPSGSGVSCGGHAAVACEACPLAGGEFHGEVYCNGDCTWTNGQCMSKESSATCLFEDSQRSWTR